MSPSRLYYLYLQLMHILSRSTAVGEKEHPNTSTVTQEMMGGALDSGLDAWNVSDWSSARRAMN